MSYPVVEQETVAGFEIDSLDLHGWLVLQFIPGQVDAAWPAPEEIESQAAACGSPVDAALCPAPRRLQFLPGVFRG